MSTFTRHGPAGLGIALSCQSPRLSDGTGTTSKPLLRVETLATDCTSDNIQSATRSSRSSGPTSNRDDRSDYSGLRSSRRKDKDKLTALGNVEGNSLGRGASESSCIPPDAGDNPLESSMPNEEQTCFSRSNTLLSFQVSQSKNAADLKILMGNTNARLKSGAVVQPSRFLRTQDNKVKRSRVDVVFLEQAKPRARVEVDIVLESNTCVQGGCLRGHIKLRVRRRSKKEPPVLLGEGKIRVIGFESIPGEDERHTFYQCVSPLSAITDNLNQLYESPPDSEGLAPAIEGVHVLPFVMHLPLNGACGTAKGVLSVHSGVAVQYIAMVSVKVQNPKNGKRSIAHFYRNCEIWPRLDPSVILISAPRPLHASTSKSLSVLNSSNKVKLTALLHRLTWVAGQRCYVNVAVVNETKKTVKSLTLTLIRTTTVFKPKPELDTGHARTLDPDSCQTASMNKVVAETILEMAHRGTKGHASAKGWWTGVGPTQELSFSHFILLPSDALSINRSRLVEVEYSIRVTLSAGSLSSDVHVTLPIRIINFLSIDTAPSDLSQPSSGAHVRPLQRRRSIDGELDLSTLTSSWSIYKQDDRKKMLQSQHCTINNLKGGDDHRTGSLPGPSQSVGAHPSVPRTLASKHIRSSTLYVTNPDRNLSYAQSRLNNEDDDTSVYSSDMSSCPSSAEYLASSSSETESRGLRNPDLDDPDSDEEVNRVIGSASILGDEENARTITGLEYGSCASRVSVPRPTGPRADSHLQPGSKRYRDAHRMLLDAWDRSASRRPQGQASGHETATTSFSRRVNDKLASAAAAPASSRRDAIADTCADGSFGTDVGPDVTGDADATPKLAQAPDVRSTAESDPVAVPQIEIQPLRPARHPNRRPAAAKHRPDASQASSVEGGQLVASDLVAAANGPAEGNSTLKSHTSSVRASRGLPPLPPSGSAVLSDTLTSAPVSHMRTAPIGRPSSTFDPTSVPPSILKHSDHVPGRDLNCDYRSPTRHSREGSVVRGSEHAIGCASASAPMSTFVPDPHHGAHPDLFSSERTQHLQTERPTASMHRTSTSESASSTSSGVRTKIAELEERVKNLTTKGGNAYI